jgi:hypothetical protein
MIGECSRFIVQETGAIGANDRCRLIVLVYDDLLVYRALLARSPYQDQPQLQNLSKNYLQQSCDGMMRSIEGLGYSVSHMTLSNALSDTASSQSMPTGIISNSMSPAPRKLNRKVKGA